MRLAARKSPPVNSTAAGVAPSAKFSRSQRRGGWGCLNKFRRRVSRAISPPEFRVAARRVSLSLFFFFISARGAVNATDVKTVEAVVVVTISPFPTGVLAPPSRLAPKTACNLPGREGMRLSVDGFLNANNPGNRNHRRQSLPATPPLNRLSPSCPSSPLSRTSVSSFRATRRGRCFTSREWKLKGLAVSISRRLLIRDYRLPRHSLPACKTTQSLPRQSPRREEELFRSPGRLAIANLQVLFSR